MDTLAQGLQAPFVPREGTDLAGLCQLHGAGGAVVVGPDRVIYREPVTGFEYFYHLSMTKVRLHNCRRGDPDPMIRAMELGEGDAVLDCTLGRAADAAVCSPLASASGGEVSFSLATAITIRISAEITPNRPIRG